MRHIVLFRRRREVADDPSPDQALARRMAALGAQIPAVQGWGFRVMSGWSASPPPR